MRKFLSVLIVFAFLLSGFIPVKAESEQKVIKVGYPIQSGLTEKNENGEYVGYTVDYLEEIQNYTGWEFEFVEVEGTVNEQLNTLLNMLQNGEIDMMGTMVYSDSLAEVYDYPGYSYGMAYTTLIVDKDSEKFQTDDYVNWNGMVVGTYPGLQTRYENLKNFAEVSGFTFQTKEYKGQSEIREALSNGEIDATLSVDIAANGDCRTIAKFSPVPYYFAVSKGKRDILRELNSALSNINTGNPYLQTVLYDKYFEDDDEFRISKENRDYAESLGVQKVLMMDGNAPIQHVNGEPKGVSVTYLEHLKEAIGLSYEIIVAENYEEFNEIMKNGDIDLVLGVPSSSSVAKDFHMILSLPYVDSYKVHVKNKNSNETDKTINTMYNTKEILAEINNNPGLEGDIDIYIANLYLQKQKVYPNIELQMNNTEEVQYSIGLMNKENTRLLSIINIYLNSLSDKEKQEIIYQNTLENISYTPIEVFNSHRWQFVVGGLVLFIFIALGYVRYIRGKNKLLDLEIIQQKRLNEFSRLSDECLFEYDYREDVMHIENNKVLFGRKNIIRNFMDNDEHPFLRDLISKKEDSSYDFTLTIYGKVRWYQVLLKISHDEDGKAAFAFGKIFDIDDEKRNHLALVEKAQRDNLTNLLNRSSAQDMVEALLKESAQGVCLVMDIDNFKLVNDRKGHPVGDLLLQKFSSLLTNFFRKDDIVCRLGGDEFLVFLPKNVPIERLEDKLHGLIQKINKDLFKDYQEERVSVSIGASTVTGNDDSYEALYKRADHAMYVAKVEGKNGYYISYQDNDQPLHKQWYYHKDI